MDDSEKKELRKCSRCKCTVLLETYFSKNRKGEWYKTCDNCRTKRKTLDKATYERNKEKITAQSALYRTTPQRQEYMKKYREENKNKIAENNAKLYHKNKEEIVRKQKIYEEKNKEVISARARVYREEHKEAIAASKKRYGEENREVIAAKNKIKYEENKHKPEFRAKAAVRERERCRNDPAYRIRKNLRTRIRHAVKKGHKSARTMELLGCGIEELKDHLSSKFTEGVTFENYGKWHIDHILPCVSFDLLLPEEQRKCFHYTNLQPLWAIDNIKKGAKIL